MIEHAHSCRRTLISSREHRDIVIFRLQVASDVLYKWRLASPAQREIAHTNYSRIEMLLLHMVGLVSCDAKPHGELVCFRGKPQKRALYFFVSADHRECPVRIQFIKPAIARMLHSVAPWFLRRIFLARAPIAQASSVFNKSLASSAVSAEVPV